MDISKVAQTRYTTKAFDSERQIPAAALAILIGPGNLLPQLWETAP